MDAYRFYIVLPATDWDSLVPAHWGLPVDVNHPKDDGNRDIIFGGYNRDVDGNLTTWRRPTWQEVADGVPDVHGRQIGGWQIWTYTYPDLSTLQWSVSKFGEPHLPAMLPGIAGGKGLFSLYEQAELSDNLTRVIDSTVQACIDDKTGFYTGAEQLRAWRDAAIAAGDLEIAA